MDDNNVVALPAAAPDDTYVWVCRCGCSTFQLYTDGIIECAMCFETHDADAGGWAPPPADRKWEGDTPVQDVAGNGSEEFARRRIQSVASEPDAAAIIVVRENTSHAWSKCETPEQYAWLEKQMANALDMLKRRENA